MENTQEDLSERNLTITNPIIYDKANNSSRNGARGGQRGGDDGRGGVGHDGGPTSRRKDNGNHHNSSSGGGGVGGGIAYDGPVPSVHFVYVLQTEHDKIAINCKEAGKLLKAFARVDVDVYVSPLCYDYASGKPVVTFKNMPKTFHIKVLVPGTIPQPEDDRPPYGNGEEVSLESLSICSGSNSSNNNGSKVDKDNKLLHGLASPAMKERAPSSVQSGRKAASSNNNVQPQQPPAPQQQVSTHKTTSTTSNYTTASMSTSETATSASQGQHTPTKSASKSERKRRRSEDAEDENEPRTPDPKNAKRERLHRSCKLTESPKETNNSRGGRRKPNPAYT